MAFGVSSGLISKTTSNTVQTAIKEGNTGKITGITTFGGKQELTTEEFVDSITNGATNGQSGTSSITTSHELIESNKEYARARKVVMAALT